MNTQAEVQALRDKAGDVADDVRAVAKHPGVGSQPFAAGELACGAANRVLRLMERH